MFTAALFTKAELRMQGKCPSTDEWIKETWDTHTHTQTHSPPHADTLQTQHGPLHAETHTDIPSHTLHAPTPHSAALHGQAQDIGHVCVLSRFSHV